MKFLALIALIGCVSFAMSNETIKFTDEQLQALANLDPTLVPEVLKNKAGDASHWCCSNDQPVQLVQRTKIEKEIHIVATKIKTGYTSCGFGGWSMCSIYATKYKQVAVYHIATYEIPDEQACFDHHVKCCKDHVLVAENCLSLSTISENLDLITQLVNLGLIGK